METLCKGNWKFLLLSDRICLADFKKISQSVCPIWNLDSSSIEFTKNTFWRPLWNHVIFKFLNTWKIALFLWYIWIVHRLIEWLGKWMCFGAWCFKASDLNLVTISKFCLLFFLGPSEELSVPALITQIAVMWFLTMRGGGQHTAWAGTKSFLNQYWLDSLDLSASSSPSACIIYPLYMGIYLKRLTYNLCVLFGEVFYFNLKDYVEILDTFFKNIHNSTILR